MSLQSGFSETLSNEGGGGGRIKPNPQHRLSIKPGEFTASPSDTANTGSEQLLGSPQGPDPPVPSLPQQHSGARPVKPEPLWALHLPTSTVPSPGTHGRCRGGCCAPELAPPRGHGLQDAESSGDEEMETWKEKPHSSIRRMGGMQTASSNASGPREGGRRGLMDGGCLEGAQPAQVLHLPGALPSTSLHRSRTACCLSFPYGAARGGRRSRVSWMSPARISQLGLGASHRCCRPGLGTRCSHTCARARLAPATANPQWGKMPQNCPGEGQDLSSCHPPHPSTAGAHTIPKAPRILLATA